MAEVVEIDECRAEISGDNYTRRRPQGGVSSGGGGDMDDVLKRLGAIEVSVSEIKTQLTTILPHLATKAEVEKLRAEMNTGFGALRADNSALETKIIKWLIATVIAWAGLAFTLVKFVH